MRIIPALLALGALDSDVHAAIIYLIIAMEAVSDILAVIIADPVVVRGFVIGHYAFL